MVRLTEVLGNLSFGQTEPSPNYAEVVAVCHLAVGRRVPEMVLASMGEISRTQAVGSNRLIELGEWSNARETMLLGISSAIALDHTSYDEYADLIVRILGVQTVLLGQMLLYADWDIEKVEV